MVEPRPNGDEDKARSSSGGLPEKGPREARTGNLDPTPSQPPSSQAAEPEIPRRVSEARAREQRGVVLQQEQFLGPIPPPDHFAQYEEILPGSADRIVRMAESALEFGQEQARGYRELQAEEAEGRRIERRRGQLFGFVLAVLFLAVSAGLIAAGHGGAGIALVFAEIAGLVGLFVWNNRERAESDDPSDSPPN